MAGVVGPQDWWVVGSRMYVVLDSDTYYQALRDLGVIGGVISPNVAPETIELVDPDGGIRRTVDETLIETVEDYEVTLKNFSLDNLALFFLAAESEHIVQSATVLSNVSHKAVIGPGYQIKLKNAAGEWLYNVASVAVKHSSGSPSYAENTDWRWVSKERAIIEIISGGAIAHGQDLKLDITPNAYSGRRLIRPQTSSGAVKCKAMIVWSRGNNAYQTVREMNVSLTPVSSTFQIEDYSEFVLRAKVLTSPTDTIFPAGRLVFPYGSLPSPARP